MTHDDTAGWRARLRYRFDTTLGHGSRGLLMWLFVATLLLILVGGALLALFASSRFGESVWQAFLRAIDSGAIGADAGGPSRIVALGVTIGGIFIVSALISVISAGLDARIDELRKGKTQVIERDHTLILGWSPKVSTVVAELSIANASRRNACIVVLAPEDKVVMEDELRGVAVRPTRVVCRTGDTASPADLMIAATTAARSVLIVSADGDGADASVVRTVLALLQIDPGLARLKVTAELKNRETAQALAEATDGRLSIVVTDDVIARIAAQACRQRGLSQVFQELLDFDGDEIYLRHEPSLVGHSYGEAQLAYEACSVIGLRASDGTVRLNPDPTTPIGAEDRVVVVAEDDSRISVGPVDPWDGSGVRTDEPPPGRVEHTVILGWNALGPSIVAELDRYVADGSTVDIVVDAELASPGSIATDELRRSTVTVRTSDTTNPRAIAAALEPRPDQVIVLCYRNGLPRADTEARTLLTLLLVRRALTQLGHERGSVRVVTELLDVGSVELARAGDPDDFVVSERLTGLLLTQLTEEHDLRHVFADLLDADGCEIALREAGTIEGLNASTYADVVRACRAMGVTAIGYRTDVDGVVVNPTKSRAVTLTPSDAVVVIA